jgi:hypothetical protein
VDVVTAADIDEKLRVQIAVSGAVPQMMGGVDDGQGGFDNLLMTFVEPVLPERSLDWRHAWRRGSLS